MDWSTIISAFLAGLMGSVIGPFITATIENKKDTKQYRRERMKSWRDRLTNVKDFTPNNILNMRLYSEIRPHLSEETKSMLEGGSIIARQGRGGDVIKTALLDDLAELEKKWKLLE